MTDKLKIVFSFLLFVAGIVGFYLLSDQALVLRILAILAGLGFAGIVFWKTALGQKTFGFINESIVEAKRVVWPTKKRNNTNDNYCIYSSCCDGSFLGIGRYKFFIHD